MVAVAAPPKRRLHRDDWIEAALEAISSGGLGAVAIERLAAGLGVTKGSFYAHFANRGELIEAALESWEHSRSETSLEEFAEIAEPAERLRAMLRAGMTFGESGASSVHVSLLGELADERVRTAVRRVTAARMRLLTRSYGELGFSPERARHMARLAYASFRGLLQMAREDPEHGLAGRELERFVAEISAALVPSRAGSR